VRLDELTKTETYGESKFSVLDIERAKAELTYG